MDNKINRRTVIRNTALAAGAAMLGLPSSACGQQEEKKENLPMLQGKIKHSVCRWCYGSIPLEEFSERARGIGIKSIELTVPEEWPVLARYGLTCAVGTLTGASLTDGFNDPAQHARLQERYRQLLRAAADSGIPNIIVFSGNRRQLTDAQGLENCAAGLEPLVKEAERLNVRIVMELLNSKIDHKDYQCDHTLWGAALVDKVGSTHFKLLYDIYHMQIMEGDIIRTIRDYKDYIAHFHTGGVPGRNEINDSQELHYPAIMRAIVETGFDGFVAQEFIPTYPDKIEALAEGIRICDV